MASDGKSRKDRKKYAQKMAKPKPPVQRADGPPTPPAPRPAATLAPASDKSSKSTPQGWNTRWYVVIPLVIFAAIGAYASIKKMWFEGPECSISLSNVIYGQGPTNNSDYLLITGMVSNDGEKPLFPVHYNCFAVMEDGTEFEIHPNFIPDSLKLPNPGHATIEFSNTKQKDILRLAKVSPTDAFAGNMLLTFSHKPELDANKIKFIRIIVMDVDQKHYTSKCEIKGEINFDNLPGGEIPMGDMKVFPSQKPPK